MCKKYTMKESCPICKGAVLSQKPAKYSPEDRYGAYRRLAKKEDLVKKGML